MRYPNIEELSNSQKSKIKKNIHNILSISKDKIILSEYIKGSAFVSKTTGNLNENWTWTRFK